LRRTLKESEQHMRELRERIVHTLMILSHDLRGPLVSIAAGLKLLVRGRFGNMDEGAVNKSKDLLRQAIRLSGIAEDCLARAAAIDGFGEIQRDALDLRKDIIDPIIEELADEIPSGRVMIGLEAVPAGAVTIHASGRWLRARIGTFSKMPLNTAGKDAPSSLAMRTTAVTIV
jgi:signal transduction histidine kinase